MDILIFALWYTFVFLLHEGYRIPILSS